MLTLEEYQKAQQIVKDYCVCAWHSCGKLLKLEDAQYTIQYGNEKWWCAECYEKIKNDW